MNENKKTNIKVKTLKKYTSNVENKKLIKSIRYKKVIHRFESPKLINFSPNTNLDMETLKHVAFEKFPLIKLKVLQYYLLDVLETNKLDDKVRKWYEKNYNIVCELLGKVNFSMYFCSKEYLYIKVEYMQKKENLQVGRLYPNNRCSYVYLSREIRSLLITNNEYFDFDMKNAHPTLLLEYAFENMANYTPKMLIYYVKNRDLLLKEISQEENYT